MLPGENVFGALRRLSPAPKKRIMSQQKRRKLEAESASTVVPGQKHTEPLTPEEAERKQQFDALTEAADQLLSLEFAGSLIILLPKASMIILLFARLQTCTVTLLNVSKKICNMKWKCFMHREEVVISCRFPIFQSISFADIISRSSRSRSLSVE